MDTEQRQRARDAADAEALVRLAANLIRFPEVDNLRPKLVDIPRYHVDRVWTVSG